jgi:hypothetical protein
MSKELDTQLAGLIEAAKTAGQDAFAFIQSQAPDVCEQIVAWSIADGVIRAAGFGLLACIGGYVLRRGIKLGRATNWPCSLEFPLIMGGLILSVFGMIGASFGAHKAAKAYIAPKVVLMEVVAGVVRK